MTNNRNRIDSTRTIISQQEQKNNGINSEQSEPYDYYNNNTRARAREEAFTDELPGNEIMEQIAQAYRDNIGPTITRAAALVIEDALRHGMEPVNVIMAIEETGMASRPSPYYLKAVLRNWAQNGVVLSRVHNRVDTTMCRPWWR